MISSAPRRVLALTAVVLGVALTVSGCGGNATPRAKATQTPVNTETQVPVPSGVTLTKYGAELKFGESATVAYAPNNLRKSVVELTVLSASRGSIADLSSYSLDDRTRASTVYYVRVSVKNVGTGDVGRSPIPLLLVDNRDTLLQPSKFENAPFTKCPSLPLPTAFGPNAAMSTCMVFLAPDHGTMTAMSFRPDQAQAPIVWKGVVTVPAKTKKKAS
jgi:hypothetical protein